MSLLFDSSSASSTTATLTSEQNALSNVKKLSDNEDFYEISFANEKKYQIPSYIF